MIVTLLQGSSIIAARIVEPPSSFTTYSLELTDAEIEQITDYTNLSLRVIAGNVSVVCCANDLPSLLYLTVTSTTGACACLDGLVIPLVWNPSLPFGGGWQGSMSLFTSRCVGWTPTNPPPLTVGCLFGLFYVSIPGGGGIAMPVGVCAIRF